MTLSDRPAGRAEPHIERDVHGPFQLMAITDRHLMGPDSLDIIASLAEGLGSRFWIMVREKDLDGAALFAFGAQIREVIDRTNARLVINSRLDVALSLGPEVGIHLPESGLPLSEVRGLVGAGRPIGRSIHSPDGARAAVKQSADFLVAAPVFKVPNKTPCLGVGGLTEIRKAIGNDALLFGLGGITQRTVKQVPATVVDGIAAIRSIWINDLVHAGVFLLDQSPPGPT
jgi:thiamine-phosphate pyrophosphorylase